jgi:hypothetical protein
MSNSINKEYTSPTQKEIKLTAQHAWIDQRLIHEPHLNVLRVQLEVFNYEYVDDDARTKVIVKKGSQIIQIINGSELYNDIMHSCFDNANC